MASGKTHHRMNHLSANDATIYLKNEDRSKFSIFDNINVNLGNFYIKEESLFKKKVDKLNLRFYLETDKFLNHKHEMEKSQDNLFLLLFKQVSLYVEEIEKLHVKLRDRDEQKNQNRADLGVSRKEMNDKEVSYYKSTIRNLEKRISETKINEDKLKKENESFKRQVLFYKDKLKLELSAKKNNDSVTAAGNMLTPISRRFNNTSRNKEQNIKYTNLNEVNKKREKEETFCNVDTLEDVSNNLTDNQELVKKADEIENKNISQKKLVKFDKLNSTGKMVKKSSVSSDKFGAKNHKKNKTINFNEEILTDIRHTETGIETGMNLSPLKKTMKRRNISAFDGITDTRKNFSGKGSLPPQKKQISRGQVKPQTAGGVKLNSGSNIKDVIRKKRMMNRSYENDYTCNNKAGEFGGDPPTNTEENININFNNSTIQNVQVNMDNKELNEFANIFYDILNEELDLLNKEEEVLNYLKNNILHTNNENSSDQLEEMEGIEGMEDVEVNTTNSKTTSNTVNNQKTSDKQITTKTKTASQKGGSKKAITNLTSSNTKK